MVFFTVLLFSATGVYAELHDRGGGLIYDDVLNVTWLQDTNYAKTSGYDDDGSMNWYDAIEWVGQLEYSGYDDWRLPATVDGPVQPGYDGTTTAGYNITNSEMGYMFYVELGNLGFTSTDGIAPQLGYGLTNAGPFLNLQSGTFDDYWSGTEYSLAPVSAWNFRMGQGRQHLSYKTSDDYRYAWAVRDGDVIPIILYGWDRSTTGGGLVAIDTVTGEKTLMIEAPDRQIEGLAFDSITKTLYGVEQKWGIEENVLVRINLNDGIISDIGPVGFNEVMAMTFDETTGTIFALDQTTKTLIKIDPTTGSSIAIGNFSYGASNGLAAHPITGELFASVLADPGYLAKIDKNTGSSTLIGSFGDCLVSALSFYPQSGVLYGKAGGPTGGPFADGRLVRIDSATGLATPIGSAIGQINAFAFVAQEATPSYSCAGFKPPCDKIISLKNKNRSIPFRTQLFDSEGLPITDADIMSPPKIEVTFESNMPSPSDTTVYDGLPPAKATDGNEFIYEDGEWHLNIKIRDYYEGSGTYTLTMESGDKSEYLIDSTYNSVTVVLEK